MNFKLFNILLTITAASLMATAQAADQKKPPPSDHYVYVEEAAGDIPFSHKEIEPIGKTEETKFKKLSTFTLDGQGNILACDSEDKCIKKLSPDGKLLARWQLDFGPWAIDVDTDKSIYIAGIGVVARLDDKGKVLKKVIAADAGFPDGKASGIEVTKDDVFVCVGFGWSMRSLSSIVRLKKDLTEPKVIAENMRGCCQRLDIVAKDNTLYIAENARHRIVKCDRDGNVIAKWGQRDRIDVAGFGSCCNPMNLSFGEENVLYTAESGLGRIKKYTPDGKYLGLVGYVGVDRFIRAGRLAASCSNIAIGVSKDQSRVYVQDFKNCIIRVLAKKTEPEKVRDKKEEKKG